MNLLNDYPLFCPIDARPLHPEGRQLVCAAGHSFDLAKQGYVNLLPVQNKKSKSPGDSKAMVEARRAFLHTGAYDPIAAGLTKQVRALWSEERGELCVLDAGCGEGFYLGALAEALGGAESRANIKLLGVDISKPAVVAAAKKYKEIAWVVGSNHQTLVPDGSQDVVLCLFGFPCFEVFSRALKSGGKVVLADAGPDHLIELRELIYPSVRRKPLPSMAEAESLGFELVASQRLRYSTRLRSQAAISDLMLMTPHFFKAGREGRQAVAGLTQLAVTVDVSFRVLSAPR